MGTLRSTTIYSRFEERPEGTLMTDQMITDSSPNTAPPDSSEPDYEVVVIGAGVGGIYQIKRLIDLGVNATVLEGDEDLGGTWYRNRYPGARFDSESFTYGYSWDREVLEEWHWKEMFSPQPETLKYLNYVADKFGLRDHMQFNCYVEKMVFDEPSCNWTLFLKDGREITSRFVLTAIGLLSVPTLPRIKGIDDFEGASFHTFDWPLEPIDLEGKRVAVIGTGATAIQLIPEVAKEAETLTVFQRRANWAAPLNNREISEEEMADIRKRYDEIFETCARTPGGFEHAPDRRGFYNVSAEERRELWDRLYDGPGFGIWLQNFVEIFMDEDANAEFSEYIAERIRQRVDDPDLAEKLIPKDHGFGIQRVPLETDYFEAYNRDNVHFVDSSETPIQNITKTGVQTSDEHYEFDVIVYATGFDAFTGAFDRMDVRGVNGLSLKEKWSQGPVTYLGLFVHGFPNLMMISGPQTAATNFPRGAELAVNWATGLLEHLWASDKRRFETSLAAEQGWFDHVVKMYEPFLLRKAQSWITGYNSNLDGHEYGKTRYNIYNGGGPKYAGRLQQVAQDGYEGIAIE
ncbi:MAG: NAD(P)/FAD-dependent oxidoreductase [Actinomycetota bacterium]|nr:NAD(P)/FAD-dependent oxidoreductase [Acidimicrobiales bacterium]MEC7874953.1 NAD(P)/FAD-dependent oxidoreductase [Actinomycetota bacterium]MEC9269622.1 NAD(P)/FAD-dependent oxidoreductase [Actinomycetota bacterium]MEC9338022.1 NAD(P)/FAD-dependent oxidoreductase [Actinomycetota bacterium]